MAVHNSENIQGSLVVDIRGMHCAACSSRIEKVVGGMEGVANASVNLAAETLDVKWGQVYP